MNPLDELKALTDLFPEDEPLLESAEHVPHEALPPAYRKMLAHHHHMTVTMEEYYGCSVDVRVIEEHLNEDLYIRKIVLLKSGTEEVVQFGIVRFHFQFVTSAVKEEILARKLPLGRVLISHNVLRHIDLGAVLRLKAGPSLGQYFGVPAGEVTYGRLATIFCNQSPAVDLLEIPAPLVEDRLSVRVNLIVAWCKDLEANRQFYEMLGLQFVKEQHDGPSHYAAKMGHVVFELYPLSHQEGLTIPMRLGFTIKNLNYVRKQLQLNQIPSSDVHENIHGRSIVVTDPDGRKVELIEPTIEVSSSSS